MGMNNDRLDMVRALIETAPDAAVRSLEEALRGEASGQALSAVKAMVRAEISDRNVRDVVVGPVAALCSPRTDGFKQALFPAGVLPRLWKALRTLEPRMVTVVASNLTLGMDGENYPPACDDLCRAAAKALREDHPDVAVVTQYLEDFRPGSAVQFAGYLELTPLARKAVRKLPAWLRNMNGEHAAAVRLLFKDADDIAADASPRLMEMLLAHVAEPWTLLRVLSAVTKRGGDRYLSSSEFAEFCERVMADIDRHLNVLRTFDYDAGPEAAAAAAQALAIAIAQIAEFEDALDLGKEGPWGQRVTKQKGSLSSMTEGYLKKCPKIVGDALPTQPVRIGGTVVRTEPRLDQAPDARAVRRAMTSLSFFDRCRPTAAAGGYGSVRTKIQEEVTHRLDTYIEDLLSMIHSGDADSLDNARAYIEVVADLIGLAVDEKSAQIVRRRAAAAA